MNHRLTHQLVGIVVVVVLVATLGFSLAVTSFSRSGARTPVVRPAIPAVSHPASATMAECARCHTPGPDDLPPNHAAYGTATCLTCHRVAPVPTRAAAEGAGEGEPAPVPHPVGARYDDCVGCHVIGGNLGMPEDHVDQANETCIDCHAAPAN